MTLEEINEMLDRLRIELKAK